MAKLSIEGESVNRSADHVLRRAEERGINVDNVTELKQNARNLTGPEVAEVARGIAGPPEERAVPPADVGPGVGGERGPDGATGAPDNETGAETGAGDERDGETRDHDEEMDDGDTGMGNAENGAPF